MNINKIILLSAISILAIFGLIIWSASIRIHNTELELRNGVVAQQKITEANLDKMFKTISQIAEVPDQLMSQSKEAFKEIYIPIMEGRYSGERGGALMSWIQENNPQFDINTIAKLYENLQIAIESNREDFFRQQTILVDKQKEHSTYICKYWQKKFLPSNIKEITIKLVTSTKTQKAFETGKEDDISIFNK